MDASRHSGGVFLIVDKICRHFVASINGPLENKRDRTFNVINHGSYGAPELTRNRKVFNNNMSTVLSEIRYKVVRGAITGLALLVIGSASSVAKAQNLFVYLNDQTIHKITPGGVDLGVWANAAGGYSVANMPFDSAGNLFAAYHNSNLIEKFTPGGVGSVFANTGTSTPYGLAIDSADNVYIANLGNNTIEKYTPGGVGSVFGNTGLNAPVGIAIDSSNNVYASNLGGTTIEKFTTGGVGSTFASTGLVNPAGLNFDSAGNLYASNFGNSTIERFTPGGVGSLFANLGGATGFGLAIDSSDNVYVSIASNGNIRKITQGGAQSTFVSFGLTGPYAMAFQRQSASVPEPGIIALGAIGVGTAGMMIRKRRRSRK